MTAIGAAHVHSHGSGCLKREANVTADLLSGADLCSRVNVAGAGAETQRAAECPFYIREEGRRGSPADPNGIGSRKPVKPPAARCLSRNNERQSPLPMLLQSEANERVAECLQSAPYAPRSGGAASRALGE